jgi:hypothetical protein
MSCDTTFHSFIYVDRSNDINDDQYVEYYVCIECGKEETIMYEAGKMHSL